MRPSALETITLSACWPRRALFSSVCTLVVALLFENHQLKNMNYRNKTTYTPANVRVDPFDGDVSLCSRPMAFC